MSSDEGDSYGGDSDDYDEEEEKRMFAELSLCAKLLSLKRNEIRGGNGISILFQVLEEIDDIVSTSDVIGHAPDHKSRDDDDDDDDSDDDKDKHLAWRARLHLLQEIDRLFKGVGDVNFQRQAIVAGVERYDYDELRPVFRFLTLPHILPAVWNELGEDFQKDFIRSFIDGFDPTLHCTDLRDQQKLQEYLDSVSFVLDNEDILNLAHTTALPGNSPELVLWLKRQGRFSSARLPRDAILSVWSSRILEQLVGVKGIDFNCVKKGDDDDEDDHELRCALQKAQTKRYVQLLFKGGFRVETMHGTNLGDPDVFRWVLEEAAEEVKKHFSVSQLLFMFKDPELYFLNNEIDFIEPLYRFKFEPDIRNVRKAVAARTWCRSRCGAMAGALVSFGFLKVSDLPKCCLKKAQFCWRPIVGVHKSFPKLHKQVYASLLVFKRYGPQMPKDLRNDILIRVFGKTLCYYKLK